MFGIHRPNFILHPSSFIPTPRIPRPGIEPGFPPSESGVVSPLDHQGMSRRRKGRESNPHVLADPDLAGRRVTSSAHPPSIRGQRSEDRNQKAANRCLSSDCCSLSSGLEPRGVEPRDRVCKTQRPPAGDPVRGSRRSDLGGSRTHTPYDARLSTGPVYRFQHEVGSSCGPGSRTRLPGL